MTTWACNKLILVYKGTCNCVWGEGCLEILNLYIPGQAIDKGVFGHVSHISPTALCLLA